MTARSAALVAMLALAACSTRQEAIGATVVGGLAMIGGSIYIGTTPDETPECMSDPRCDPLAGRILSGGAVILGGAVLAIIGVVGILNAPSSNDPDPTPARGAKQ